MQNTPIFNTKSLYFHDAQVLVNMILARLMVAIWGRGTGKTYGVTAPKAFLYSVLMPRSVGAIAAPSYQHMMEHIFPQILKCLKAFGLKEGKDFVCFVKPPDTWVKPHIEQVDYKRLISFRWGSAFKLISYNTKANGESIDWIIIDEARLCPEAKVAESLKCLRGNEEYFGHLACHKSVTFVTDMPRTPTEFWLLKYKEQENEQAKEEVEQLALMRAYADKKARLGKSETGRKKYAKIDAFLFEQLNEKCKDLTYVSFASSLENIYALGIDTIKNWHRTKTSDADFNMSVLNLIPPRVENCFYAQLSKDVNGYLNPPPPNDDINYREGRNCLWDGDLNPDKPLYIGMDYNTDISSLAVGQMDGNVLKLIKIMFIAQPKSRSEVVATFAKYYLPRENREVIYFYDNTAKGTDADKDKTETYAARTIDELTEFGYKVSAIYLTQTTHQDRYDLWADICTGGTPIHPYKFMYNIENAGQFEHCASTTQTKLVYKEFSTKLEKDKRSEKSRKVKPQDASHITEAVDTLVVGMIHYNSMLYDVL